MHRRIIAPAMLAVGLAALLYACSGSTDELYSDYAARMARLLDVPIDPPDWQAQAGFPPPRERLHAPEDVRVGLGDAWALRPCLEAALVQRNSMLGKVMPASQVLLYEHRFQRDARACLTDGEAADDPALARAVRQALASKSDALSRAAYNLVVGDAQLVAFWSLAATPLSPDDPRRMPAAELRSLDRLLTQVLALEPVAAGQLEATLGHMQGTAGLGSLVQAQWQATAWLNAITEAMQRRMDQRPLCFEQRSTPTARRLNTVLQQVFIGRIQPHLADIARRRQAVVPAAQSLLAQVAQWRTPAVQAWQAEALDAHGADRRFRQAAIAHVKTWDRLLRQCGLKPGGRRPESGG